MLLDKSSNRVYGIELCPSYTDFELDRLIKVSGILDRLNLGNPEREAVPYPRSSDLANRSRYQLLVVVTQSSDQSCCALIYPLLDKIECCIKDDSWLLWNGLT